MCFYHKSYDNELFVSFYRFIVFHPLWDQELEQGGIMIESDRELSAMVQELWDNDVNRLKPGKDYKISLKVQHTHTWQ